MDSTEFAKNILPKLVLENELAAFGITSTVPEAEAILEGCKSILSFAWPFDNTSNVPTSTQGYIARCARGRDYHIVLREKLSAIVESIKERLDADYVICVDDIRLNERKIAYEAGVGWIGKNGNLYVDGYGSFVGLGEILTTAEFEANSKPIESKCCQCIYCINACNTGALNNGGFTKNKCLSYMTQKSGNIEPEYYRAFENTIYGCDSCQNICPFNNQVLSQKPSSEFEFPEILELIDISKEDFNAKIKPLPYGWIGTSKIRRNARIAAKNLIVSHNIRHAELDSASRKNA